MENVNEHDPKFAVGINNSECPASFELNDSYRMLHGEDAAQEGDTRVVDESGEDYLYPADWFAVIDVHREVEDSLL